MLQILEICVSVFLEMLQILEICVSVFLEMLQILEICLWASDPSILAEENEGDDSADHALIKDVLILLESQGVIVIVHSGPLSLARYFLPWF
jgi:hypothetical protein